MSPNLLDLLDAPIAPGADPACHACHGSGIDTAFGGSCGECHRGTPIRARFADAPYALDERAARPQGNGSTSSTSSSTRGAAPAADATSTDEAALADWLREQTWSSFAVSLAADYMRRGYFTPKQYASGSSMRAKCEARRAEKEQEQRAEREQGPAPIVPAGWYCLPSSSGLRFYRVDTPSEGRWAGRTFVTRVIGGDRDCSIRGDQARNVLAAIAADPDAGPRYGREIGYCCRCNRVLTDEASRAAGIGPICAAKGV